MATQPAINLAALGLSNEALAELIVDHAVNSVLHGADDEEIGESLRTQARIRITKEIERKVDALGNELIAPQVSALIDAWQLVQTNAWGEAKSEPVSFSEYLVRRAENYLREKVNYDGKTKEESGGYSWSPTQERLAYMIDKHLQYHIRQAMEKALATVTTSLGASIAETVRLQLAEATKKLSITVGK